jgi:hypothetical protein
VNSKQEITDILIIRKGRANAITSKQLSKLTGEGDRQIRLIIRDLIKEGLPIASATESPAGYFLTLSVQEKADYIESVKGRLIEDAKRIRDYKRAFDYYTLPTGQGRLI